MSHYDLFTVFKRPACTNISLIIKGSGTLNTFFVVVVGHYDQILENANYLEILNFIGTLLRSPLGKAVISSLLLYSQLGNMLIKRIASASNK